MTPDDIVQMEMDKEEKEFKQCFNIIAWFFVFLFILLVIFKALE